jgi:DNA polymerase (family X)
MRANNSDIARAFEEIATLLELSDANPFKVRAYRNAAQEIKTLSFDIADRLANGEELPKIYGVGEELAAKIREIVQTGRCGYLDGLRARFPPGITELLTLPGLGPKRVRVLYQKLGVGSAADLQRAVLEGRVRELEGFGPKSEKKILEAVERLLRRAGGAAR